MVGIGDADNDIALLACCGVGVAVHSATPTLKRHADYIAKGGPGRAIVEVIDEILGKSFAFPSSRNGKRRGS